MWEVIWTQINLKLEQSATCRFCIRHGAYKISCVTLNDQHFGTKVSNLLITYGLQEGLDSKAINPKWWRWYTYKSEGGGVESKFKILDLGIIYFINFLLLLHDLQFMCTYAHRHVQHNHIIIVSK